ncbi:hypothetical protein WJX81_005039 [Elliptochloris bilobata]|uniref:Uncharacterized protein n=1 Tax=Elliptochloris bilobata TaxID=381761 RepID=A0AAW1SJH0_9CHLO
MPAKKKPAAKKEGAREGPVEPEHDPRWEQAVTSGVLDFSPADLPDANTWPTHGALRERLLLSCRTLELPACHAARDAFLAELVRLALPELARVALPGAPNLTRIVVAPVVALPALAELDLTGCPKLGYVFLQCPSLHTLLLDGCAGLSKAVVYCKRLDVASLAGCTALGTLLLWSDQLTSLSLLDCPALKKVELRCPALTDRSGIPSLSYKSGATG